MERPCPVYALMPLRVVGLTTGGLGIMVLSLIFIDPLFGSVAAVGGGYATAMVIQKASEGFPGGYIQYKLSNLLTNPSTRKVPVIGDLFGVLSVLITKSWQSQGLLSPPYVRNRYHY